MKATFAASAPGRAGIIGNPSDIYGGVVVSCSVPTRNRCTLTLGEAGEMPDDLRLWNAIIGRYPIGGPFSLKWETVVPRSSGLSGSTAMLAATLLGVLKARDEAPDLSTSEARTAFAELVRDIERHDAGIMCGYQDAYMIAHGGVQRMYFAGKHPVNPGPWGTLRRLDVPIPFLLVTTGVERLSGAVHGPMSERWMKGEPAVVQGISRIADLGRQGAEALEDGRLDDLARLMTENHEIVASLGGSGEAIDSLISACIQSGSRAAKLAGAGLGGTVIALTEDPEDLQRRLTTLGYSRFIRPCDGVGAGLERVVAG